MHDASLQRSNILGTPVDHVSSGELSGLIGSWLLAGRLRHVVTVNPEFVMAARKDPAFAEVLQRSSLALADGVGITIAGRLLGLPSVQRITGVDLVELLAERSAQDPNCRLFLLGAAPGVAAEADIALRRRFPGAQIVGIHAGDSDPQSFGEIQQRVQGSGATVLLVAFGHPTQDLWIDAHRDALRDSGILVAAGIGGAFDYLSGRVPRAPRLVRRLGFEWAYRLIRQPWRWRRQLALPRFVLAVLRERISKRKS